MTDKILILDFGSQYTQLIARRVREAQVYCEIKPWNAAEADFLDPNTRGVILSGGPLSVYAANAPKIPATILQSNLPILGICYGMQALTVQLGGEVTPAQEHEYGLATIQVLVPNPLLPEGEMTVWMSHGDRIKRQPPGWQVLARSANSPIAAIGNLEQRRFGLQFHPEVRHTPQGAQILRRFVIDICGCKGDWTPASIIEQSVASIRAQVAQGLVLSAVSGGVDSSVATALAQRALGEQVYSVFIDTGLLRKGERQQVETAFRPMLGERLTVVDASERFLSALQGVTDPEVKRKIIGETFIHEFEAAAQQIGSVEYLVQGTIYPDVVESQGLGASQAQRIKSHHNVGGLPADLHFKLVEPLRLLFKDEVRAVGEALGLPRSLVWRQPFPGPGLAVRCLGEIARERLETLREADAIFTEELERVGLLQVQEDFTGTVQGTSQAFAVLLPIKTVGVMGDQRSYQEVVALRAVTTTDFMTADWARLPQELLAKVSSRIVNEIPRVNRVVYDITSKPPATIEWE
ncbi:MAG: glutamine-hydrolyzing GMP synthase [Anaerolineaceae bacterium]